MGATFIPDTYSQMSAAESVILGRSGHAGDERRERFVHSSVQFLDAGSLPSSSSGPRSAKLRIESTTPPHLEESWALERDANSAWGFKWWLVATGDVVCGRNSKAQRVVTMRLPRPPDRDK